MSSLITDFFNHPHITTLIFMMWQTLYGHYCCGSRRSYQGTPIDTQTNYLKDCFDFLGITEVEFIYEEGLAMLSKEESLTAVKELFNNIKSVRAFLTTQKKNRNRGVKINIGTHIIKHIHLNRAMLWGWVQIILSFNKLISFWPSLLVLCAEIN